MDPAVVQVGVSACSVGVAAWGITGARRSSGATLSTDLHLDADAEAAELPAEIEEQILLASETGDAADDIAARQAGIAHFEARIAEAKTAEERMPMRRRVHQLRVEIEQLGGPPHEPKPAVQPAPATAGASSFDGLWAWMYRLPPLGRRTTPWLAAVIGFVFGGIGLALYLRKRDDTLVILGLIVLGVLFVVVTQYAATGFIIGAIAAIYGYVRSQSSNERLASTG